MVVFSIASPNQPLDLEQDVIYKINVARIIQLFINLLYFADLVEYHTKPWGNSIASANVHHRMLI